MKKLKVLVACESSGVTRNAFAKLGLEAWPCDFLPAKDKSDKHLQCDVKRSATMERMVKVLNEKVKNGCLIKFYSVDDGRFFKSYFVDFKDGNGWEKTFYFQNDYMAGLECFVKVVKDLD